MFRLYNFRNRLLDILDREVQHFQDAFRNILKEKKHYLAIIVISTIILFFNKYIIGYIVAISLSSGIDFNVFIGLQIIQYFLIYFAPTPGASGLAEVSSTWLMQTIMSAQLLVFFAIYQVKHKPRYRKECVSGRDFLLCQYNHQTNLFQ